MRDRRQINPQEAAFGEALFAVATALSFDLDAPVIAVYWHAMKAVPHPLRVEAVNECANRTWFKFPKPAEIKAVAAELMAKKRKAAAALHLDTCEHSSHFIENERGQLERCPCWKRAQEAMASVGQAIALPSDSREDHAELGS